MKRYLLALPPLLLITVWVMLLLADKGLVVASDRCQAACEQALRDAAGAVVGCRNLVVN